MAGKKRIGEGVFWLSVNGKKADNRTLFQAGVIGRGGGGGRGEG